MLYIMLLTVYVYDCLSMLVDICLWLFVKEATLFIVNYSPVVDLVVNQAWSSSFYDCHRSVLCVYYVSCVQCWSFDHRGQVIYASVNQAIIGSDNGLSPIWHLAIFWISAGL